MSKSKEIIIILTLIITSIYNLNAEYNSYIIKIKSEKAKLSLQAKGFQTEALFDKINKNNSFYSKYLIIKSKDISLDMVNNILKDINEVEYIEPNFIYRVDKLEEPNDSLYSSQWSLTQINAQKAWAKSKGKGIIVGVIDTGIEWEHPDLIGQLWINEKEDLNKNGKFEPWSKDEIRNGISGDFDGIDNDGNGFTDDVIGYDFVDELTMAFGDNQTRDCEPEDECNHGTPVAGIIAAQSNNKIGLVGIAPECKILTSKCFNASGTGESDDIAAAIVYATDNGAKVLNCSFGDYYESKIIRDAIDYAYSKACVVVASSGNNNNFEYHYPSDYDKVICVSGSNERGGKYSFGNYGSFVDISAPGQNVFSTKIGKIYGLFSGTSAAAPHVSAAAALLLAKDNKLIPSEVQAILKTTAYDAGEPGWDDKFGDGIVNCEASLNYSGISKIAFEIPNNEQLINVDKMQEIKIVGSVIHPLFLNYEIKIGTGKLPTKWKSVFKSNSQALSKELANIDITQFIDTTINKEKKQIITKDTIFTISIYVNLKNGSHTEERIHLYTNTENNKLKLRNLSIKNVFLNTKRAVLLNATFNKKCSFYIKYKNLKNEEISKTDYLNYDFIHQIIIEDDIPKKMSVPINIYAYDEKDTLKIDSDVILKDDNISADNFTYKYSINKRLSLLNKTTDLFKNGKKCFAANNINSLAYGPAEIYQFDNGKFNLIAESKDVWIPKDFGDINGNGVIDILFRNYAISNIYEANANEEFFKTPIFSSNPEITFWGEKLMDIDNDKKDEIIATNYQNFFAYDTDLNKLTYQTPNPKNYPLWANSAKGNFDIDLFPEIVYSNEFGMISVYEVNNGFIEEYADTIRKDMSSQALESGDFDGDGVDEILHLRFGSSDLYDVSEKGEPLWVCTIFKKVDNTYKKIWEEYFFGVRQGTLKSFNAIYQNGLATGDLNGDNRNEFCISVFPNFYIFQYDSIQRNYKPIWYFPSALANSAIIEDFDNNGLKEVGFCSFNNTLFFEYDKNSKPGAPVNLQNIAMSDSTSLLYWTKSNDAEYYEIGEVRDNAVNIWNVPIYNDSVIIRKPDDLQDKCMTFTVRAINNSLTIKESDFAQPIEVCFVNPISKMSVKSYSNSPLQLVLGFNGILEGNSIEPSNIKLFDSQGKFISAAETAIINTDTSIIASFLTEINPGKYSVKVTNILNKYGSNTNELISEFIISQNNNENELYLTSLNLIDKNLVEIFFSDSLNIDDSEQKNNYEISPFGTILSAGLNPISKKSVLLLLSSEFLNNSARGVNFTVSVKNLVSTNGNKMTLGPGSSLSFVFSNNSNENAYVYPQPIKLSIDESAVFAGLTKNAIVEIITLDGRVIRELTENDGNGGVEWDLRNYSGEVLEPGIYLYRVNGKNKNGVTTPEEYKKIVIIE